MSAPDRPPLWRSLEEWQAGAISPETEDRVHVPLSRREFLRLMGASLALGGLTACGAQPATTLVPYVHAPDAPAPLVAYYASALVLGGAGEGVIVKTELGRPIKIDGNPQDTNARGRSSAFTQAAVLDVYDPDRSRACAHRDTETTWPAFQTALLERLPELLARQGHGLALLTPRLASPSLRDTLRQVLAVMPNARLCEYEPLLTPDAAADGARLVFGEPLVPRYAFGPARTIVSLDADVVAPGFPGHLAYARDIIDARRLRGSPSMNRLYVIESTPTLTGAMADARYALDPYRVSDAAFALAGALGLPVAATPGPDWIAPLAKELRARRGASLILAGASMPPAVHALAFAMNTALGNLGHTITFTRHDTTNSAQRLTLPELTRAMHAGAIDTLLILDRNPVYDAPVDLDFAAALARVPFSAHAGLYRDETAARCVWHANTTHALESFGDAEGADATLLAQQPVIEPLYGGHSAYDILGLLLRRTDLTSARAVRDYWANRNLGAGDFERAWRAALERGSLPAPAAQTVATPRLAEAALKKLAPPRRTRGLVVQFVPSPAVYDGRFANNPWLQELPQPLTKLTWDNAAYLSPATAHRLGVKTGDVLEIAYAGRRLEAPAWVLPGQSDDCVTLPLGYGRTHAGRVGNGVGFNAYALRRESAPWFDDGAILRKTGARHAFATTQGHDTMAGRDLVRVATLAEYARNPTFAAETTVPPGLHKAPARGDYAWAMVIDLQSCIGCGACVVACQAENNIPVVGKREILRGHRMHWLRVDRYYAGAPAAPATYFQPVPCMHCEQAPCELVCPVEATLHDDEGLNLQVYNRCVGTRFCSNNCPYKVRRFNWFNYTDAMPKPLWLQRNPDVTVRGRGVMEKCSYCVQRIRQAHIAADKESRRIRDGEVVTACQGACPTRAISFGDLQEPASEVVALKADPRNYALLASLNTRPRTTYLARVTNPPEAT